MSILLELGGIWQADIGDGRCYAMQLPGTLDENRIGYRDCVDGRLHPDEALGCEKVADVSDLMDTTDMSYMLDKTDPPDMQDVPDLQGAPDMQGVPDLSDAEAMPDVTLTAGADKPIATRFTRKHTYEGAVQLRRRITVVEPKGKRIFLEAERARCLRLFIDDREVIPFHKTSLSTPHVFEVSGLIDGTHEMTIVSDNSYPGLPHDAITYSSAATDETQTNWNGILGYFRLRAQENVFIEAVRVYPVGDTLTVRAEICADRVWEGTLCISSKALGTAGGVSSADIETVVAVEKGMTELVWEDLPVKADVRRWDEEEGFLYEMTVTLSNGEEKTVSFGIRDFGWNEEGRLSLNGRTVFLRSEANCAVFPETGYAPMSVGDWMDILQLYRSYGVNCMRFHSHCPPEAAFTAADRIGMLMQPELSHWNPKDAFESEESFAYYETELRGILRMLANHPSFVMLTLGNELHASEKGHERMRELLRMARSLDATRLYADGSNVHYGEIGCEQESDFYTSSKYFTEDIRGTFANMEGYINHCYPGACTTFDGTMEKIRQTYKKPVFSFEVGQFEILPDFGELEEFRGISDPVNLRIIKERVDRKGLSACWKRYVEASGELAKICYREEIEAAMRTRALSGISLLGLQDFPGQGTALVGMLDSHLHSKPYDFAKPEAFRAFFAAKLPLVLLPKYTYESTETLHATVEIANFGKEGLTGNLCYELSGEGFSCKGELAKQITCLPGMLTRAEEVSVPLAKVKRPCKLQLKVSLGEVANDYPIWVYPRTEPVCPDGVLETEHFDEAAKAALEAGKSVYLTPQSTKEALPDSIQAQFSPDFWSVGTFPEQEGGMGQLIDEQHPIFREFPTDFHSNWQWWAMAVQRAVILPERYEAIIAEMDSYAYLRPMAKLLECRCGKGKLLFSTMGLQDLQQYPEARALLSAIYRYLASPEFTPEQEIAAEVIEKMVR